MFTGKTKEQDDRFKQIKFINKGEYEFRYIDFVDSSLSYPNGQSIREYDGNKNYRILAEAIGVSINSPCSKPERRWINIRGNCSGCLSVPLCYFKNNMQKECFPFVIAMAVKDTMNQYAPDEYCLKFPNDVVCKTHWKKTCGMLTEYYRNYTTSSFSIDTVACPKDEEMRKEGVKACCMKNHTSNLPDPKIMVCQITERVIEILKDFNDLHKFVENFNNNYNKFRPKYLRLEINNEKADPSVDGALFCDEFPNAMLKGYLNGELYNVKESFYNYIDVYATPKTKEKFEMYEDKFAKQLALDHEIQDELEKKNQGK